MTAQTRPLTLALWLLAAGPVFAQEAPAPAPDAAAPQTPEPAPPAAPAAAPETPAAEPAAPDASADMLEALSPLVADVQVVGPWTDGDRNGIWRTVTLQPNGEGAGNRFFVQQIEEVDGAPAVSSSTEITEIGELAGAIVTYRADAPTEEQPELLTLFLDIVPLDGEIAETYELFFTTAEPYIFGPASN